MFALPALPKPAIHDFSLLVMDDKSEQVVDPCMDIGQKHMCKTASLVVRVVSVPDAMAFLSWFNERVARKLSACRAIAKLSSARSESRAHCNKPGREANGAG